MEVRRQEGVNTDLRLMRQMASEQVKGEWPKPKNMAQLATLLKFKNAPNNLGSEHVEKGRSWLRKQGIDIDNICSKLDQKTETADTRPKPPHEDSYFYVDLSLQTIPEYLQKSYHYSTMNIIQHVMTRQAFKQRKFITHAVEGILSEEAKTKFKITWAGQRVAEQREVYIRAVKNIVRKEKEQGAMIRELLEEFKSGFYQYKEQSIWQILSQQLANYLPQENLSRNLASLSLSSLKLVEAQFQRRIRGVDIDRYLSTNYLHRIYGNSCEQKETIWGKVWIYMMAGMHRQAVQLVSHRYGGYSEFINTYMKCFECIERGSPQAYKIEGRPDIKDIFYSQILYCLNGESKYSNELLFPSHSLELIWLLLRTTAIFSQSPEKLEKLHSLREGVIATYKDCTSDPQLVKNMLYLLDYEGVIKLGPNMMMNQDDYLHFVLILSNYPALARHPQLQKLMIDKVCQAIIELMVERREEYVYYIVLLPHHAIVPQLSSIIISSQAIDSLNWKQIQQLLSSELYLELVKTTVARLVSIRGDYLKGAEKLMELIGQPLLAIEYLVAMLIRHNLGRQSFTEEQLNSAQQFGLKLSFEEHPFQKIFQILVNSRVLKGMLISRDEGNLQSFVSDNRLVFLDNRAIAKYIPVLEKLGEMGGISVYFNFLRDAVKANQMCTIRAGKLDELRNFKALILSTCNRLLDAPRLKNYAGENAVEELLAYLRLSY